MQLLHIDSSVLGANSASRALSAEIVERQRALHPGLEVTHRDLAADAALHLSPAHLAAWQGGAVEDELLGRDIKKGGGYLEELIRADIVVIGAPMYNFSIPSQLKAWIDRVVIAGKTFRYGPNGAEGLLANKKVFVASSRGNVYAPGSPTAMRRGRFPRWTSWCCRRRARCTSRGRRSSPTRTRGRPRRRWPTNCSRSSSPARSSRKRGRRLRLRTPPLRIGRWNRAAPPAPRCCFRSHRAVLRPAARGVDGGIDAPYDRF